MNQTKTWDLTVRIVEHLRETRAEANLTTGNGAIVTGRGVARRHPYDSDVPMIGDELAVSRALSELSHKVLGIAADEISRIERHRVTLDR